MPRLLCFVNKQQISNFLKYLINLIYKSFKMDACNQKTVFVIDHSPYFGISSEDPMEFEQSKSRFPNVGPLAPITKSLWTCSLEAAIEYCRIVWDLFPSGKLIRFIASDTTGHNFNTWNQSEQNIIHVLNGSLVLGAPPIPVPNQHREYSVIHGLKAAVDAMSECTEEQHNTRKSPGSGKLFNHCRVVCITSTRDDESMQKMQEIFLRFLATQNKQAATTDHIIPIQFCHLVVINIFPNNGDTLVTEQPPRDLAPILRTEVHSARAGKYLTDKLSGLILGHYDLASTTVTGIPMKEEQNASSSANYDVEIFHHANAHTEMFKADMMDPGMIKVRKTMTLKWCTPRGSPQDMYNCTAVYRVTPVDVNSRPSSCLINFLLSGRSVLLEMPRRSGGKTNSHLLSAHGGEIFIHALSTGRSVLEDPPSISEGCGGRVTDYRVADFGAFIQANKVLNVKGKYKDLEKFGLPIAKMKNRLERQTRYWPITISGTFIFNLRQYIDPLPQLIVKDELTTEEVALCRQVIYNLVALETKHESLAFPSSGVRGKVPKKEEQYKQMWNELEKLVRLHCRSEAHNKILYSLMELRSKEPDSKQKVELDDALRELDVIPEPLPRASVIRATTDSPMSPPPAARSTPPVLKAAMGSRHSTIYSAPRTVLDIWTSKVNAENKSIRDKRPDFLGRQNGELVAQLYAKKAKDDHESNRDEPMVE